jgi:hypothetical protein
MRFFAEVVLVDADGELPFESLAAKYALTELV